MKRGDDGNVNDVTLSCAPRHQTTVFLFCKLETLGLQTSKVESSTFSIVTSLAWASGRAQQESESVTELVSEGGNKYI